MNRIHFFAEVDIGDLIVILTSNPYVDGLDVRYRWQLVVDCSSLRNNRIKGDSKGSSPTSWVIECVISRDCVHAL